MAFLDCNPRDPRREPPRVRFSARKACRPSPVDFRVNRGSVSGEAKWTKSVCFRRCAQEGSRQAKPSSKGRLPERKQPQPKVRPIPEKVRVDQARQQLDVFLMVAVASSEARQRSDRIWTGPRIGMRATTGLGLSTTARRHVTAMLGRLKYAGLPRRLLNLVPSLALADETKKAWSSAGCRCHGVAGL